MVKEGVLHTQIIIKIITAIQTDARKIYHVVVCEACPVGLIYIFCKQRK